MFTTIENENFICEVNSYGAELHSLRSKENGKEYIWYGKEEIWYGQAPVLFPVIGQLKGNVFKYQGNEYPLAKHGFARKSEWALKEKSDSKLIYSLESNPETKKMFPFEFELLAEFELSGAKLTNKLTVINKDGNKMYFSIGAHPGFNCSVGDVIEFEENETVFTERIDKENLLIDNKFPLLKNSREITITKEIFEPDALIISGLKSKKLRLKGENEIEFTFGDCPVLGIWAKPGAPYVCLEPWYGINDSHNDYDDISQKREILPLDSEHTFSFEWSCNIIK